MQESRVGGTVALSIDRFTIAVHGSPVTPTVL